MKKISWKKSKGGRSMAHLLEGYVDGELAFMIEGTLCVSDLRAMKASYNTDTFEHPKHYEIKDKLEGKEIASDLLNGLNVETHQANWQRGKDKDEETMNVIKRAQDFLDSLKN